MLICNIVNENSLHFLLTSLKMHQLPHDFECLLLNKSSSRIFKKCRLLSGLSHKTETIKHHTFCSFSDSVDVRS